MGTVPNCGTDETRSAIDAAYNAWAKWRSLSAKERSRFLKNWHALIEENKEDLAKIITLEMGKPLAEAISEISYANNFLEWFAEEGKRIYGDIIPSNKLGQHLVVIKQSIGVAAAITPWNFPSAMITRKCAPALAAGCPVVIKPSSETPFSALALMELAHQAGFPKGVVNIVTGDSSVIGKELTTNNLVRKLSFTGSTAIGKLLMQQCGSTVKKLSLELGGNAPFIVFEDADIDKAVSAAIAAKFRNTGQTCICANRIFIQNNIFDEFATKFTKAVNKLRVGNGLTSDVHQGPLINQAGFDKVKSLVDDAVSKSAKIMCCGHPHELGSLFFEPTILTEITEDMRLVKEEIFGPVASLFRFDTEEEVVKHANNTNYGLAAYFFTRDSNRIWRVAENLEFGIIGSNEGIVSTEVAPFGGFKESGIGREGSKYGIDEFLEIKYLCMGSARSF